MKLMFKYNIEVRDVPRTGKTWMIFKDYEGPDKYSDIIYIDHLEIKVPVTTIEKSQDGTFGMICEGEIEQKTHHTQPNGYVVIK